MRSCPTCNTKLALTDTECQACLEDILLLNGDANDDNQFASESLPNDGLAVVSEIVSPTEQRELIPAFVAAEPEASPSIPRAAVPVCQHTRLINIDHPQAGDSAQRITIRRTPRSAVGEPVEYKPAPFESYIQIKERVREKQERKARRIVTGICAVAALVLVCAGAVIVSHARTRYSTGHDSANSSRVQNSADFNQLESGRLGSS